MVFDGSTDYHDRINDPALDIDERTILVIRGAGPLGWPGSAEVVNMQPPDALLKRGITSLPTIGDGRQSGTADSPSILNASPESAAGGGLAWLRTGDMIRIDLNTGQLRHAGGDGGDRKPQGRWPAAGAGRCHAMAEALSPDGDAALRRRRHRRCGEISSGSPRRRRAITIDGGTDGGEPPPLRRARAVPQRVRRSGTRPAPDGQSICAAASCVS